jgi:hypothetical protein
VAAQPGGVVNALQSLTSTQGSEAAAAEALELMRRLQPICRSITGNGVRETLKHVGSYLELKTFEVPSGTRVFDWEVPKEWNIRDAWLKDPHGRTIASLSESTLRVVSYSTPIRARMPLAEACRSRSCARTCIHCPITRTGLRTAPAITARPGASACGIASWKR